jgi:DNA-binding MurR/RpiR family transcriptional regulator
MASRLTLRIQERQSRLTGSEKKIAQVILANQGIVETHTATELAQLAGVSKATTARFFRALGYADFEEVKVQAREERNRTQPYRHATAQSEAKAPMGRTIGDHLALEIANLTRTFEEMRPDLLTEAARLITDAPRVWFLGMGAEEGVARLGRAIFSLIRHDVMQLGGNEGSWAAELAMTGPRDALVLLTLDPRPRVLRSILAYARTTHMRIVTLTDHAYMARAQRFSDIVLPCHVANYGLIPTHATLASLLRLIAIAHVSQASETAIQRSEIIEAINEELDIME